MLGKGRDRRIASRERMDAWMQREGKRKTDKEADTDEDFPDPRVIPAKCLCCEYGDARTAHPSSVYK